MPTLKSSSSALSELDGVDPMLTIQLTALNRRAIRLYQAIELMLLSLLIRLIFQRRNIYHDCERHRLWRRAKIVYRTFLFD